MHIPQEKPIKNELFYKDKNVLYLQWHYRVKQGVLLVSFSIKLSKHTDACAPRFIASAQHRATALHTCPHF